MPSTESATVDSFRCPDVCTAHVEGITDKITGRLAKLAGSPSSRVRVRTSTAAGRSPRASSPRNSASITSWKARCRSCIPATGPRRSGSDPSSSGHWTSPMSGPTPSRCRYQPPHASGCRQRSRTMSRKRSTSRCAPGARVPDVTTHHASTSCRPGSHTRNRACAPSLPVRPPLWIRPGYARRTRLLRDSRQTGSARAPMSPPGHHW